MSHNGEDGEHWLSISDMMSGLMVIFLFIAITYMMQVSEDRNQLVEIAVTYEKTKIAIYNELQIEFRDDLKKWNAEIDKDSLAIRFQEPDILFDVGDAVIKTLKKYQNDIEEIRIEGHTSSEWSKNIVSNEKTYFLNMELSQNRTRATLEYCLMLPNIVDDRTWIKKILTANGLSSSKPILTNGNEDTIRSRRVEFRIKTNSEHQILRILQHRSG